MLFLEGPQSSDEWGNSWMLEFVQVHKIKNITYFKQKKKNYIL